MKKLIYYVSLIVFVWSICCIAILSNQHLQILVETQMINLYHPRIVKEKRITSNLRRNNNWQSVQLLSFRDVVLESISHSSNYVGALLIPSLKMNVPLANYTDNKVYTCGAGMLTPEYINTNHHLVVGAHNLGDKTSSALFTPLAYHSLSGRQIIITNFKDVNQYIILSKQIISPWNDEAPFKGGEKTLSLVTCTSDNRRRILVKAKLVKRYSIANLNIHTKAWLNRKYKLVVVNY